MGTQGGAPAALTPGGRGWADMIYNQDTLVTRWLLIILTWIASLPHWPTGPGAKSSPGSRRGMHPSAAGAPVLHFQASYLQAPEGVREGGPVRCTRDGRVSRCGRDATPLKDAADWVERYRQIWTSQFDALSDYLERTEEES